MRIIGGKYRGKIFNPPANLRARPTTDFAKEALFNVINNIYNFENLEILDLFSGTGSISYEFISRGSRFVTAVELNPNHAKFILRQFEALSAQDATVVKADAFRYLSSCRRKFDIIFADAPYDIPNTAEIYELVFKNNLLKDDSLLIIEHSENLDFSSYPYFSELRKYGSVHFSFFSNESEK
jgi:16S rRNA (guanine(966)-N(2))-methyltransferase RsmD